MGPERSYPPVQLAVDVEGCQELLHLPLQGQNGHLGMARLDLMPLGDPLGLSQN